MKDERNVKQRILFFSGIDILENQVKEAKEMVEESDIKYDEVARKLAMVSSHFLFSNCLVFLKKHNKIRKYFQSCTKF